MSCTKLRKPQSRSLRVEPLESRNLLATITVNQLGDSSATNNDVSLREAIEAANLDASIDGSVAGSGPDTIVFDSSLAGSVIRLNSELLITKPLTIDASSLHKGITIDANQNSRVFNFDVGAGNLTLKGLNITGGLTTVDNAFGDTTNSGGGIRFMSAGTLTLNQSTVYDNRTEGRRADGGGIFTDSGSIVIKNSTLSGNSTAGGGAEGGGLHTVSGTVTVENSTITQNRTTGFNSDGGGIFVSNSAVNPAFTIVNSIVADNSVSANSLLPDVFPGPNVSVSIDYSLIGNTMSTGITPITGQGNILNVDSELDPIADNGGLVLSHAPSPTSPVINSGDPNFNTTSVPQDQRGAPFVREFDSRIDIGAFESQRLTLIVSTDVDESDGDISSGDLSLREAVELTSLSPNFDENTPDIIEFGSSLSGATILLNEELLVTDGLTIDGSSHPTPVVVDGQHATRLINFDEHDGSVSTLDLNLIGLSLTRGRTTDFDLPISIPAGGGGVRFNSTGTLSLIDSTITDSQVKGPSFDGGAIVTEAGNIELVRSTLSGNETDGAASRGGAVATTTGSITLTDSTVSDNLISGGINHGMGGGLYTNSGDITLLRSTLQGNQTITVGEGGAIATVSGNVALTDSNCADNSTAAFLGRGGCLFASSGSIEILRSTLSGNSTLGASSSGGAIYSVFAPISFIDSTASGNSTVEFNSSGGAIHTLGADIEIVGSTFDNNFTLGDFSHAGAVSAGGTLLVTNSTFSNNHTAGDTSFGGGIYARGTVNLEHVTIKDNRVSGHGADGGGLYISSASERVFLLHHSIVAGNDSVHGSAPDLRPNPVPSFAPEIHYNLIGDTSGSNIVASTGIGNLLNIDPLLGPLADNGGITETHAPLTASPAIDGGDPSAAAGINGVPEYDQRGTGFSRVNGTQIDIGAHESQTVFSNCDFDGDSLCDLDDIDALIMEIAVNSNAPAFDLNGDGTVSTLDRDQWLADAGAMNLPSGDAYLLGDANLDGVVDISDFNIWNANKFSNTPAWSSADFNADGFVDISEFNIWNSRKFQSADRAIGLLFAILGNDQDAETSNT